MTNNLLVSEQQAVFEGLKDKIFIELLIADLNSVNLYSYLVYNQRDAGYKNKTNIRESFVQTISLNELSDVLNSSGKIKGATLIFPNIGFCRKQLYRIIKIIEDSGINYQIFFNFKQQNDYLSYTLKDMERIIPINKIDAIKEDDTDYCISNIKYESINHSIKRCIDIMASLVLLILLSPFFLIVGVFIRLYGANSIFYKPTRVGLHGKSFKMYKFKSMYDDDYSGLKSTVENDPRITPIGKFIRRNNIDELPQLYNVLRGEMSLVGPRPHRVFLSESMHGEVPNYSLRYLVKPGITGWAQANGWRGPTDTITQKKQRTFHDIYYVGNWNIFFDIKIMFMTLFGKKSSKNAF